MLAGTLSITISGTAHTLSKIKEGDYAAEYRKIATGLEIYLNIRHVKETKKGKSTAAMQRHNVDLLHRTLDPTGVIPPIERQVYTVIRTPEGADIAVAVDSLLGLNVALAASTAALLNQIVSWES